MQNYALALSHHKRDLSLGYEIHSTDAIKRATANLGRCYVKMGRFKEAVYMFQERLKLSSSAPTTAASSLSIESSQHVNNKAVQQQEKTERAWLFHDLARCNLEMNNVATALDYAQQSVQSAEQSKETRWCLNTKILLGQIQGKPKFLFFLKSNSSKMKCAPLRLVCSQLAKNNSNNQMPHTHLPFPTPKILAMLQLKNPFKQLSRTSSTN